MLTQPAVTCAYVVSLVPINGNSVNAAAWRQVRGYVLQQVHNSAGYNTVLHCEHAYQLVEV